MGKNSGIQWTHHTFNPWVGCQRVSPGCVNCYAEAYDKRVGGVPKSQRANPNVQESRWGPDGRRVKTSLSNWREPLKWDAEAKAAGERRRVFVASLADVFEDRPELVDWRMELFGLISRTPNLDWLLLTKRPENLVRLWPKQMPPPSAREWPNIWLGTTVEDQRRANERIPHLVDVPAKVRFLSMEPLLEAVDLSLWLDEDKNGFLSLIGWIIIGGESGNEARPFLIDWARSLVKQCRDSGRTEARPFVKQMGSKPYAITTPTGNWRTHEGRRQFEANAKPLKLVDRHGGDMAEWPEDLRIREFPEGHR